MQHIYTKYNIFHLTYIWLKNHICGIFTHICGVNTHICGFCTHICGVCTHICELSTHICGIPTHICGIFTHICGVCTHICGFSTHICDIYTCGILTHICDVSHVYVEYAHIYVVRTRSCWITVLLIINQGILAEKNENDDTIMYQTAKNGITLMIHNLCQTSGVPCGDYMSRDVGSVREKVIKG